MASTQLLEVISTMWPLLVRLDGANKSFTLSLILAQTSWNGRDEEEV